MKKREFDAQQSDAGNSGTAHWADRPQPPLGFVLIGSTCRSSRAISSAGSTTILQGPNQGSHMSS